MKRIFFLAWIFCSAISVAVQAQTKDERAVADAVKYLTKAMIDGDRKSLDFITSPALSYGHSGWKIEDKATFVDNIASGRSDFVTVDLTEQTVAVSGKTAMVRHKLSAKTNDGGNPATVNLGVLLVFQKEKSGWKLLARQAVKLVTN